MQRINFFSYFAAILLGIVPALDAAPKPHPTNSMRAVLSQTAAVVEGSISAIRGDYDAVRGPRTIATLSNLRVHLGSLGTAPPTGLRLESFGGKLPNGKTIHEVHVPVFSVGQRVIVFLRNTEWFLSPVVGSNAFLVEPVAGRQVVLTGAGATILGIDATGVVAGREVLPMNEDGIRAPQSTAGVAPEPGAMGIPELTAAIRRFAAENSTPIAGVFNPSPISSRPLWSRLSVPRATPPAKPVVTTPCFAKSPPGSDSDEVAVKQCLEGEQR